jgi:hypothetical protein
MPRGIYDRSQVKTAASADPAAAPGKTPKRAGSNKVMVSRFLRRAKTMDLTALDAEIAAQQAALDGLIRARGLLAALQGHADASPDDRQPAAQAAKAANGVTIKVAPLPVRIAQYLRASGAAKLQVIAADLHADVGDVEDSLAAGDEFAKGLDGKWKLQT